MVIRGFPEEARRPPAPPEIKPVIEPPPEVKPGVEYVYVPQYPPTGHIPLNPNLALIALGMVIIGGIIIVVISKK